MSQEHVFVISEWLPRKNCDQDLWKQLKNIMALTAKETGCISARALRQRMHPGSPSKSKYTIVLFQEYIDLQAFDIHCDKDYVRNFFKQYVENEDLSLVEEWSCRLFDLGGS